MVATRHERFSGIHLARLLQPDLAAAGFKRDRTRWNRSDGQLVDVINLQTSKSFDRVTVDLGVFDPVIDRLVGIGTRAEFVSAPDCVVSSRLGTLEGKGDGPWWPLAAVSVDPIRAKLFGVGLPWLDRLHTRSAIAEELDRRQRYRRLLPIEAVRFAFLKAELGDRESACKALAELRQRVVGVSWPALVEDFSRRLSCSVDRTAHVTLPNAD